jgi:hypothetical protein
MRTVGKVEREVLPRTEATDLFTVDDDLEVTKKRRFFERASRIEGPLYD